MFHSVIKLHYACFTHKPAVHRAPSPTRACPQPRAPTPRRKYTKYTCRYGRWHRHWERLRCLSFAPAPRSSPLVAACTLEPSQIAVPPARQRSLRSHTDPMCKARSARPARWVRGPEITQITNRSETGARPAKSRCRLRLRPPLRRRRHVAQQQEQAV